MWCRWASSKDGHDFIFATEVLNQQTEKTIYHERLLANAHLVQIPHQVDHLGKLQRI